MGGKQNVTINADIPYSKFDNPTNEHDQKYLSEYENKCGILFKFKDKIGHFLTPLETIDCGNKKLAVDH
ncbi:hypothetical protein J6590_034798 [Homalodisca vitripennis]|nr:hypothetical protein J6590_034798 [Homalodisca vitripennis]